MYTVATSDAPSELFTTLGGHGSQTLIFLIFSHLFSTSLYYIQDDLHPLGSHMDSFFSKEITTPHERKILYFNLHTPKI